MEYIKKYLRENKVLVAIVIVAAILRFGTTSKLMVFTPDEEYMTYLAQSIIKDFHVIWIGISSGSFDLYYGPWWIYIITPLLTLSKSSPVILGYFGSLLGVAATILIYFLGKEVFSKQSLPLRGKKIGIIASLIYATSPLIVYYDQKGYPSGVALLSIIMILSLIKFRKNQLWLLPFTISFGLSFSIHLSLLPIVFVAIYLIFKKRKSINKRIFILSAFIFLIISSPLIAFDYFHKGSNITTPIRIFEGIKSGTYKPNIPYHFQTFFDSMGRSVYLPAFKNSSDEILYPCSLTSNSTRSIPSPILSVMVIIPLLFFILTKNTWRNEKEKILALLLPVFIIPFITSSFINPVEYYLLPFFPILFLVIGDFINKSIFLNKIKYGYLIIILFAVSGIFSIFTSRGDYGFEVKKNLTEKMMAIIGEKTYSLTEEGDCHKYEGWRYMFSSFGKRPVKSSEDSVYGWIYKDELTSERIDYDIFMVENRANIKKAGYKYSFTEGGFTGYVYER